MRRLATLGMPARDILAEHVQRARIEFEAVVAQQLHDSIMGAPISDADRVRYTVQSLGVDPGLLDVAIAADRAMRRSA